MLEQVNRLAVAEMRCDWSVTFTWDDERRAFRLHAAEGSPADIRLEFEQIDLAWDSIPLFAALEPGRFVEIEDVERQVLVPVALLRRARVSSVLYVPIDRAGRIVALHAHGYYTRTGPFSERQRRIALGIAHATALAVANATLIADLRSANRLKSEFVSTMSHELRTPLNVITGYADLLAEGAFDPVTERQRATIERIRTSALDLLELVNATLDLSRLESGRDPVARVPIEIGPVFAELGRELEAMVQPGVTLAWDLALGGAEVWSDRAKLKTILKNLTGNALKFTPSGRVDVRATADGACLRIAVRDTGIGIAPADLPVIFDMFRQGDGSDSRRFGGVGLGLHIVQRLVDQLGGQVTVASVVGSGSTFTIVLPDALRARAASAAELGPPPIAAHGA
jgi:signal transduction histidine kinase